MAKVRASLAPPRLSLDDMSEVSSSVSAAESNIHVRGTRKTRSGSDASSAPSQSTPPTSLHEESVSDAASEKRAMDAQLTGLANDEGTSSRRSSRHRPEPGSYNVNSLLGIKRNKSVETLKKGESRSFSGQTLVNETASQEDEPADTPRRKLLDDLKTLDPDWDVNNVDDGGAAAASSGAASKPTRRKSLLQLDRFTSAVGNGINMVAKKVLGKRSRDETETSSGSGGRRQSTRLSSITFAPATKDEDEQEAAERPSKMARVASSLSMHSLSSTLHLTKPKPTAIAKPRERPVKKYQRQGLYVGQNPDDYDPVTKKPKKRKSDPDAKVDKPFLPLPMFGYLERERHFVIPYGVFAPQWRERGTEKPKDWGKINKNRFVGEAKDEWRTVKLTNSLCACKHECGEDCWNRAMGVECDNNNCNVGPECSNRDFSELSARMARAAKYDKKSLAYIYNAGVEVVKTSDRGFGVRACRAFEPNEIITEYTGEIITQNEGYRRVKEDYAGKSDYYQMEFDQGMILDATRGSLARFVNHSCNPNCAMVKRNVSGQPRMALFAGDNGVMTGEELTYDYNFDPYSTTNVQACLCGSSNCRQFLGPKPAGEKKPSSKKEQLDMAMNLKRTASGASKRKASELHDDELEIEIPKELIKKRKVPQMSKGWAYVDEDMERQRLEEAEKDRVLRQLQRDGILSEEVKISRPKYPSRSAVAAEAGRKLVTKAKEMISSGKPSSRPSSKGSSKASIKPSPKATKPSPKAIKPSPKAAAKPSPKATSKAASKAMSKVKASKIKDDDDEPRPMKTNVISRGLGSIKRKGSSASAAVSEKRKSTLSQSNSLRQSTLSFNAQARSVSGTSGEALLRTSSNTSATEMASKRASYMSRTSSKSKRNSTVRMVSDDE